MDVRNCKKEMVGQEFWVSGFYQNYPNVKPKTNIKPVKVILIKSDDFSHMDFEVKGKKKVLSYYSGYRCTSARLPQLEVFNTEEEAKQYYKDCIDECVKDFKDELNKFIAHTQDTINHMEKLAKI